MSALDDILGALPADAISQQVGASPDEVRAAAAAVLPALLGGLQANAGDPSAVSVAGTLVQVVPTGSMPVVSSLAKRTSR